MSKQPSPETRRSQHGSPHPDSEKEPMPPLPASCATERGLPGQGQDSGQELAPGENSTPKSPEGNESTLGTSVACEAPCGRASVPGISLLQSRPQSPIHLGSGQAGQCPRSSTWSPCVLASGLHSASDPLPPVPAVNTVERKPDREKVKCGRTQPSSSIPSRERGSSVGTQPSSIPSRLQARALSSSIL